MNRLIKDNFYLFCLFFFSFAINFYSANKGVLPIDTFLHYDSSSNILKGNIPIRDFWIVHGLTLDYMQAFFFNVFGVNWLSYIIHSSIFNVIITIVTFKFFLLFNIKSFYAFLLAVSFSILAYPVSGTPFIDQHAIFFCLLSFYLFFFGIKKDSRYFYFIPLFFILAFFSKPVPTAYLIILFGIILLYYFYINKDLESFKKIIFGLFFSIVALILFFLIQDISFDMFLTQLVYYPISIGQDRLFTLDITLKKIISNYKLIILPLLAFIILFFFQKTNKKKKDILFLFLVFLSFNIISIYHQLLTINQNFIFFLIPINLSFLIIILENFQLNKKKFNIAVLVLFVFCIFTTAKYYQRFIIEKKFHDLQNVNLTNFVKAQKIHESLRFLKWKTPKYDQPIDEINLIRGVLKEITKEKEPILLMSNYNFISSISKKKIVMLSRTYDDISFPNKKNQYYATFKNFFHKKVNTFDISTIYLVFHKNNIEDKANRYIYEYFDKESLSLKRINDILIKFNFNNCKSSK